MTDLRLFPCLQEGLVLNLLHDSLSLSILPACRQASVRTCTQARLRRPQQAVFCGKIDKEFAFVPEEEFSAVQPYRSLKTERLKLSGTGAWEMEDYLLDNLWLPFVEPDILFHHHVAAWDGPVFTHEDRNENLALARLWDSRGLLALFHEPHPSGLASRVFNAHKNATTDRQIGDRRWLNSAERHPQGPSMFLPAGPNLTMLHCPKGCKLVACASDRKDFYRQSKVTRSRAWSNLLPFCFEASEFAGSAAFEELLREVGKPTAREGHGDRYGMKPRPILHEADVPQVWAGFKSLFQGDHLGVEFALSSHAELLKQSGLLTPETYVLRHHPFPSGELWEGLVIDDYLTILSFLESLATQILRLLDPCLALMLQS